MFHMRYKTVMLRINPSKSARSERQELPRMILNYGADIILTFRLSARGMERR
jgi:hypothetical protein